MYGTGMIRGLGITMRNLVTPNRMFNIYQYPNRKASPIDLAKIEQRNPAVYMMANPIKTLRALIGLETISETLPQNPRFRGEEFAWYDQRCTGCASCAKYCPLGIIEIETHPGENNIQEGTSYDIDVSHAIQ